MRCGACDNAYELHCDNGDCDWLTCRECKLIISDNGAIPTWERYVAEGRNESWNG